MKLAKRTRFGRLLCRLFGEETGQTMMEYVVLGVLVVAAAVAVVLIFGKDIRNQFNVMSKATVGDAEGAKGQVEEYTHDPDTAVDDGDAVANMKKQ